MENPSDIESYLIVIFGAQVRLVVSNEVPGREFILHDEKFENTGLDTFYGFYDWLRTDEETIVGIRMDFFTDKPVDVFEDLEGASNFSLYRSQL